MRYHGCVPRHQLAVAAAGRCFDCRSLPFLLSFREYNDGVQSQGWIDEACRNNNAAGELLEPTPACAGCKTKQLRET